MHCTGVIGDEYRRLRDAKARVSSMGSPPRDPYHNRSMEPRLSRDPPRESFNLMVVGEAGLGKTTLLESFFKSFKVRRSASLPFARALCAHGRRTGPLARTARPPRHHCRLDRTRRRASHRSRRFSALVSYPYPPMPSPVPTHPPIPRPPALPPVQDDDATFALFERKETHSVIETRRQIEEASARRTVCERDIRV